MDDEFDENDESTPDIDDINFEEFDEMFDSTEQDIATHMKNVSLD